MVRVGPAVRVLVGVYVLNDALDDEGFLIKYEFSADDLAAFPADRDYDLAYEFSPEAHTAIAIDEADPGYETYHTYPEHDLTVYTRTRLERT